MINAYAEEKDGRFTFSVNGHAGFAPYGQDLLCNSASTIMSTLAEVVNQLSDYCEIAIVDERLEYGDSVISADVEESARERFLAATFFFSVCFAGLQQQYPKYVCFTGYALQNT